MPFRTGAIAKAWSWWSNRPGLEFQLCLRLCVLGEVIGCLSVSLSIADHKDNAQIAGIMRVKHEMLPIAQVICLLLIFKVCLPVLSGVSFYMTDDSFIHSLNRDSINQALW